MNVWFVPPGVHAAAPVPFDSTAVVASVVVVAAVVVSDPNRRSRRLARDIRRTAVGTV
jgi:hypothetical protein